MILVCQPATKKTTNVNHTYVSWHKCQLWVAWSTQPRRYLQLKASWTVSSYLAGFLVHLFNSSPTPTPSRLTLLSNKEKQWEKRFNPKPRKKLKTNRKRPNVSTSINKENADLRTFGYCTTSQRLRRSSAQQEQQQQQSQSEQKKKKNNHGIRSNTPVIVMRKKKKDVCYEPQEWLTNWPQGWRTDISTDYIAWF